METLSDQGVGGMRRSRGESAAKPACFHTLSKTPRKWTFLLDRPRFRANFGVPLRGVCGYSVDRSLKTESESIVTYSGPESCNNTYD
jgi:hypothetical protein